MRRGCEDEGLGKTDKNLTDHDQRKGGRRTPCAGITKPITQKDQDRRRDYRETGAPDPQGVEGQRRGNNIGEEENRAEPVYDAWGGGEEGRGGVGDRGE